VLLGVYLGYLGVAVSLLFLRTSGCPPKPTGAFAVNIIQGTPAAQWPFDLLLLFFITHLVDDIHPRQSCLCTLFLNRNLSIRLGSDCQTFI
jgi:hypothetical protein